MKGNIIEVKTENNFFDFFLLFWKINAIKWHPFRNTTAYYLCNFKLYYLGSTYLCGSLSALRDLHLLKVWT